MPVIITPVALFAFGKSAILRAGCRNLSISRATLSVHCGDVKGKWQPHFSEQSNEVVCLIVNI